MTEYWQLVGETSAAVKSHDGASQNRAKDVSKPGSKVKKKSCAPEVTLPPIVPRPPPPSPAFWGSRVSILRNMSSDTPSSAVKLPRLKAQGGSGRVADDMKRAEGFRLMASTSGTGIPVRTADESTAQSLAEKDESIKATAPEDKKITTVESGKATKAKKVPLTGAEVVQILAKKRELGQFELYCLKEVDGYFQSPYNLHEVSVDEAGPEHYDFTPYSVYHVTESGHGGCVSLAEWCRESELWKAMREIPFFREFKLRKAFTGWHRHVRKMTFQRRCENLQEKLLMAVPQFRNSFYLLTRVIEELRETSRLPGTQTFTLPEFKNVLMTTNQECVQILEKLSQCRAGVLHAVNEECYKTHKELQLQIENAKKSNKYHTPINLHLAHLKRESARSEAVLQKLGNFAALVDQMIVQSLIMIIQQDVMKRETSEQCCLLQTELCFSANTQLTVEPLVRLFQEAVSESLFTFGDSVIQMCDTSGVFLEISGSDLSSDLTSDLSCIDHPAVTGHNDGTTGHRKSCCRPMLGEPSIQQSKQTSPTSPGVEMDDCHHPLPKEQLEWQISINDVTKQAEKEQAEIMQEAQLEIQQLCVSYSWLVDVHLFTSQWCRASLESLKGQPASLYEEHIKKFRHWIDRICTTPSSVSTLNQQFIVQCSHIKESLGQQLSVMEEEVLEQLVEQTKLHSESLISDLQRAAAVLETEPQDLNDFSNYAFVLRESQNRLADMQKCVDYIHSLRDTICMNHREMTKQEVTLEEKMLALWDSFTPLLNHAESIVCDRLPSMTKALDKMLSSLARDLRNVEFKATSGPFLDPTQNAKKMVSEMSYVCANVQNLNAKLECLSRNNQNLHEHPMDITILTTHVQNIKARKELWELIAEYTTWMEERKQLLFSEVVVSQDQGKIAKWKEQAQSLTAIIPTYDAVLRETLGILESLSHQIAVMAELQSPPLKAKHWKTTLECMGLLYDPAEKVTVAELMSQLLNIDQTLITKICRDAQVEYDTEQAFQKLQQGWKARLFQLEKFTLPVWQLREPQHGLTETQQPTEGFISNLQTASQRSCKDARFTIVGLEIHIAEIENNLMVLSTMLKYPHNFEFGVQMEEGVQSLQELGMLLHLFERYQQTWAFLTKMFHKTSISVQRADLLERFKPVDETFREVMHSISTDYHVLSFVHFKKTNGDSLCQILSDGLLTMEVISNQLMDLLQNLCEQFPRLWFLSDREVVQLLSFHPTPFTLQSFVCKCFKGIRWLDWEIQSNTRDMKSSEATPMKVLGFFGSLQEHITFPSPLEPNINALVWLCAFEEQYKLTMVQLMKQCAVERNQLEPFSQDLTCDKEVGDAKQREIGLPVLDLLSKYPLQCLLVAEEAFWCEAVLQAFQESSPVKLSHIKAYNSAKLGNLSRSIRYGVTGGSKYMTMCLRALVQLTMKHSQQLSRLMEERGALESSFEWLSLMKYHIDSEGVKGSDDPTCYVEVLGHRLQYNYEYYGPEDWEMVHTPSTDRAILGILHALTSYRCGFMSGPCMSGKKTTAVQLGKALGRQVVNVLCCPNMRPSFVQRMLLGALRTGAWLLLDSVDLLTQGILSSLGQHLLDIYQSFSKLTRNDADGVTGCKNMVDAECHMMLAGKSISASPSYGCVIISSKENTSEIPESLRCATRSVALTRPDYSIIAEVMLTSIGFTEAASLSQRLVAFISLAKDSLCLPDFIIDDQSCYLVVLQKIIAASEIHIQQSERQCDEAQEAAAEQTDLSLSQNVTGSVVERDRKETETPSRLHRSHLSIVRGLMEETAIVKAVLSVFSPVLYKYKKASQFNIIFKDTFLIACQFPCFKQHIEEEERNQLKDAVTDELQRQGFESDKEIISSALTLYQTMKFSQAVMLIGPSGSGKTTCYSILAGALNHLAAKAVEYEGDTPQDEPQISTLTWNSVHTVVLFPNAMSHEELFGCFCEKRGWQDGAFAKVLRDKKRRELKSSKICSNKKKSEQTPVKWLVMDGNLVGQPGWLDFLTTLCSPEDPFLCLSSGETLPSQSHQKLIMETTDLRDANPSVVARCSLVHVTSTDLWKALWKREMYVLTLDYKLSQRTFKMWNRLAEDLFSSTLSLLSQKALTSAVHNDEDLTYGLQEVASFVRLLRALLQHFGKDVEKAEAVPLMDERDIALHTTQDLPLNLFLVAYIWGFGGHLHPRHWPQFELLARQVLFTCRYKIVVPDEESVFEHFFNIDGKIRPKNTPLANSVLPKLWKYTHLLRLMLEANQPVLLAGEPCSGKTTLCKTLLSFDMRHISLPAGPLLSSRDLRTILGSISCQKICKDAVSFMTKRLLLFVDDLHESPCDVTALETLRQSISKAQILTCDAYSFKPLSAEAINYMASCCVFGSGSNVISSRLSRLFSIFVLPSLSMDVIFSIHSPRVKIWLNEISFKQNSGDMARCIITATTDLYHAVRDQFQPTVQMPHYIFSHHDLQKVFGGMCLWQPDSPNTGTMQKKQHALPGFPSVLSEPAASVLNIAHLWMHECMRTFGDRLCSEDESTTLVSLIAKSATAHYGIRLVDETQSDEPPTVSLNLPQEPKPAKQPDPKKKHTLSESSALSEEERFRSHTLQPQILQHMEDITSKLVYGPELNPMNQQHGRSSYQDQDLDALLQELRALIDRKEEDKGQKIGNDNNITTRYVVHKQRMNQLLHILRVLLIPGGHGVLIGSDRSTGRKTTVRLAAYVTGYQLMEVHPGNENKLHEILKEAGNQTRADGVHVIILVHEGISQSVREEVLLAMAHRTYRGRYTDEELRNLVSRMMTQNTRKLLMNSLIFEGDLSQIHRNVHVFLLLPFDVSDSCDTPANNGPHQWKAQLTKALSLSYCVEMYRPWSHQALVEAAAQCLKTNPQKLIREGSEAGLSVAMAGIHQSACQYASVLVRAAQPFSPQTFMELIANFYFLCNRLHEQQQSQSNRVIAVLSYLDNAVLQCKKHFTRLQKKVAETRQHEEELLRAVEDQRIQLKEAQERCVTQENKLHDLEEQIDHIQKQLGPALQPCSLQIIKCLDPSDLEEVRRYRHPPDSLVKLMNAICLLFNRPPGWKSARQLLAQSDFFQDLLFFQRYSLTDDQVQQLGHIVHSPDFKPESVAEVSKACESLCRWVQAVYKSRRLRPLEAQAKITREELRLAEQLVDDAYDLQEEVEYRLQMVRAELKEELLVLLEAESSEREAAAAAGQMDSHVREWRALAQEAELNNQALPGDALILAAIISYLGPFGPDMRTELLSKWREFCQTGRINLNPEDPRAALFTHSDAAPFRPPLGFPIPVCDRLPLGSVFGTHRDAPSARMVAKLLLWGCRSSWVQHWPLLADTQQHLDIRSQNHLITGERAKLEKETKCEMLVCADDPELLDKLDQAAEKGWRVLVTHVERATPSPQFLARLTRSAGCRLPGLKQHVQPTHPEFCLYLTTNLPVQLLHSEIHPSVLAQVHVVDLSLGSEEIQELLLTQLLQSECKKMLTQHSQLQNYKQLLRDKLASEEDALMDYVLQSSPSALKDAPFLSCVAVCEDAVRKLQAELQLVSEELKYHESLLAAPRQLMRLAAALYQALQEVSRLSPAYYFTLRGFIAVIQEAFIMKGRPLVWYTVGRVPAGVIPEVTNRMVVQLLVRYRPFLFKSHAAVLELLLSVALLQHHQLCSEAERAAFLRGLHDIQHPVTQPCSHSPVPSQFTDTLPSWIPAHIHPELLCLERIPVFRGLIASLSSCPTLWQEYLHRPSSSIIGGVPCRSLSHLSLLQRALLWKTIFPDCLEGLAEAMAAYHPCPPGHIIGTEAPQTGNPEALSQYVVKHEGPIILTLPRGDEWTSIQPLHLINKLAECGAETKTVQVKVISFGALCDREVVLSMLDEAVNNGRWLVFNNCHLLEQWDEKVVARLCQLCSLREEQCMTHPCFRLWFITKEHASRSIPAAVRMCALPLVCDSPWNLKEELSCSLRQVASVTQCRSLSDVTADDRELLVRCAIFHSVLLQRQNYLDQGRIHRWSQDDLQTLVEAHISIASRCHDNTKALQYIAVHVVHGGHVLDSADLEVVDSVAKTCFSTESPLLGRGPHILSNIINNPGHFDLSGLLQILEQDLQDSATISDARALGFSADMAAEIMKINGHNLKMLLQASQNPAGTLRSLSKPLKLPAYSHARDRLQALKSFLTHRNDSVATNAGSVSHSHLRDFLQAEWDDLIDLVSSLLSRLQRPVQCGAPTFASLLELADLSRLERRAELLGAYLWQHNTSDPPGAYRLCAFRNARGFLVAVMRDAAHTRKCISDMDLQVQVLSDSTYPVSLPQGSVYLCGLQLRGASWDTQLGALQDTDSPQPCSMPLARVEASSPKSSHLNDTSDVHSSSSSSTAPQFPLYHCPLYLDGESGNWGLADVNIITTLPLHSKLNPMLCSLRRVRLVSTL